MKPKLPETTPDQADLADPFYGGDSLDVAICEAYEKNPALSYMGVGRAVNLSPKAVERRVHKASWKKLWASRHPPILEVLDRAGEFAVRRLIGALGKAPDDAKPMERAAHEERAQRTAERIVGWLVTRAAPAIGDGLEDTGPPMDPATAASLAKFIRSGGRVILEGQRNTTA